MAVATSIIVGSIIAGSTIASAEIKAHSDSKAADAQGKSNDAALTFEKQKDAEDRAQFDATQRANYDQYLTKYNAARALGGEYGLNLPDAKPYVPTPTRDSPAHRDSRRRDRRADRTIRPPSSRSTRRRTADGRPDRHPQRHEAGGLQRRALHVWADAERQ
jgi:hypothetical protein